MFDVWINSLGTSEQEKETISAILGTTKAQAKNLESLHVNHAKQSASIEQNARDTFHQNYMVYDLLFCEKY